jgi:hypothetical protein
MNHARSGCASRAIARARAAFAWGFRVAFARQQAGALARGRANERPGMRQGFGSSVLPLKQQRFINAAAPVG